MSDAAPDELSKCVFLICDTCGADRPLARRDEPCGRAREPECTSRVVREDRFNIQLDGVTYDCELVPVADEQPHLVRWRVRVTWNTPRPVAGIVQASRDTPATFVEGTFPPNDTTREPPSRSLDRTSVDASWSPLASRFGGPDADYDRRPHASLAHCPSATHLCGARIRRGVQR